MKILYLDLGKKKVKLILTTADSRDVISSGDKKHAIDWPYSSRSTSYSLVLLRRRTGVQVTVIIDLGPRHFGIAKLRCATLAQCHCNLRNFKCPPSTACLSLSHIAQPQFPIAERATAAPGCESFGRGWGGQREARHGGGCATGSRRVGQPASKRCASSVRSSANIRPGKSRRRIAPRAEEE